MRTAADSRTSSDSVISISISEGGIPAAVASLLESACRIAVQQLLARDIDGERQADVRVAPGAQLPARGRITHSPSSMIRLLSSAICDESAGGTVAELLIVPASENFRADEPLIGETEFRLKLDSQALARAPRAASATRAACPCAARELMAG